MTHITMGKWITIRLVLLNQYNEHHFDHWKNKRDFIQARGSSSFQITSRAVQCIKSVVDKNPDINKRRTHILDTYDIKPENSWVKGLLIYSTCHMKEAITGFEGRMLPKLEG